MEVAAPAQHAAALLQCHLTRASGIGCRSVNHATDDCTCDPSSSPINVMRTLVDIPSLIPPFTKFIGSHVSVCGTVRPPLPLPRTMMYQKDDDGPGSLGCRSPNPNTLACSCEEGAVPVSTFRLMVDLYQAGYIGSSIVVCAPPPATRALTAAKEFEYTGWYQLDDSVPGAAGCRTPNLTTRLCTCQAIDALLNAIRVIDPNQQATVKYSGSNIDFCGQAAPPPPSPSPTPPPPPPNTPTPGVIPSDNSVAFLSSAGLQMYWYYYALVFFVTVAVTAKACLVWRKNRSIAVPRPFNFPHIPPPHLHEHHSMSQPLLDGRSHSAASESASSMSRTS